MVMALEGIRILDLTVMLQGPVATQMLADMGAEVIKIEERIKGDGTRRLVVWQGITCDMKGGRNIFIEQHNRNKKGITLDLKKEKGREVIYRLVEKSDVFAQNYRGGVAKRLGVDYKTLSQYNPKLIYASVSGYGPKGPDSNKPSFDYTAQARAGMMTLSGESDDPQPSQIYIADQMGATMLSYGILTALLARELHGVGQEVNVSAIGALTQLEKMNIIMQLWTGRELERLKRSDTLNPLWNHYKCSDGKWIALSHLESDRYWTDFCKALEIEDVEKDPKFENADRRLENRRELISILDRAFAKKTREEWMRILKEKGDFIYAAVNRLSDLATDPQMVANEYITEYDHPTFGTIKTVGVPVQLSKTPGKLRMPGPLLGEHTEEVLMEIGGYTREEVAELKEQEVI